MATWIPLAVAGAAVLCLAAAGVLAKLLASSEQGEESLVKIAQAVREQARAYVKNAYAFAGIFALAVFALISIALLSDNGWEAGLCYLLGVLCSLGAGLAWMAIASAAGGRAAAAGRDGKAPALKVAYRGSAMAGMVVAGLALLGLTFCFIILQVVLGVWNSASIALGFVLGASTGALFLTIGGGIFECGVAQGEQLTALDKEGAAPDAPAAAGAARGIIGPAGKGADLFESYAGAIIATLLITASGAVFQKLGFKGTVLPLAIAGAGIVCSLLAALWLRAGEGHLLRNPVLPALCGSAALAAVASIFIIWGVVGWHHVGLFYSVLVGLLAGMTVGLVSYYYTSPARRPVKDLADSAEAGGGFLISGGLSDGMMSTLVPVIALVVALGVAFFTASRAVSGGGVLGIALAALGMLMAVGMVATVSAYGPVLAGAVDASEAGGLDDEARETLAGLESGSAGTAAAGRGFVTASAGLAGIALFAAYVYVSGVSTVNMLGDYKFLVALLAGVMLAFVFSSLAIDGAGRVALALTGRPKRDEAEDAGDGSESDQGPDGTKAEDKPTGDTSVKKPSLVGAAVARAAMYETLIPAILVIVLPILVGRFAGRQALEGLLAGSLIAGFILAMFMSNAGGAWSAGLRKLKDGTPGATGISWAAAAGGPLKDAAAPTVNVLIKALIVVSLVFIPLFNK